MKPSKLQTSLQKNAQSWNRSEYKPAKNMASLVQTICGLGKGAEGASGGQGTTLRRRKNQINPNECCHTPWQIYL